MRLIRASIRKILLLLLVLFIFSNGYSQKRYGGATLYTVREEMKEDPKGTLKDVADIGYKYIEATGYQDGKFYEMTPIEFKKYLKELGLKPLSTHMGMITFENADRLFADTKAAGFKYFVIPVPPMGKKLDKTADIKFVAKALNRLGKKAKKAGLQLLYHNHNFEFKSNKDGIVPMDYILKNTNPKYVNMQMDLYWVTKAEVDPLTYFDKYPGRFKTWHVKDMDEKGRFAPVGEGNIDFKRILKKKKQAGMKYYIVEQDRTYDGMQPLEAMKISHQALREIRFK